MTAQPIIINIVASGPPGLQKADLLSKFLYDFDKFVSLKCGLGWGVCGEGESVFLGEFDGYPVYATLGNKPADLNLPPAPLAIGEEVFALERPGKVVSIRNDGQVEVAFLEIPATGITAVVLPLDKITREKST